MAARACDAHTRSPRSQPSADWIFPVLNTSQNWYAEMTLKQIGKQFGRAGSWDEGLRVERRFLTTGSADSPDH
jgi:D-alanyl-D-alanine carboxypeptidase